MSNTDLIKTAMEAADSAIYLNSSAQISRALKAWRRSPVLGIDTEFVRERTFYANLGLVQISDGQTVWLVDPLVDGATGPIRSLLEDKSISKIVHSPSEDLDVLFHSVGAVPEPMIDSQLACALLGQPLQSGYHTAVEWLLGVPIEKDQTRSNWCARPLKQVQLKYAALDVCLLPLMWQILKERLQEKNRLGWLEEDCNRQLNKAQLLADPEDYWQRIRGIGRLDGVSLAILQSLAAWREAKARDRNLPRGFVIKDVALLTISRNKMTSLEALQEIDDLHPKAIDRIGPDIIDQVSAVLASGLELPKIELLGPRERKQLGKMRALVQSKADELGVDPAVFASKKDLEKLIENSREAGNDLAWPERLLGWRQQELGQDLASILERTQ